MDAKWLLDYVPLFGILTGAVGILTGAVGGWYVIRTFRRNAKLRRAEWLRELYRDFFQDNKFIHIRILLDHRPAEGFRELQDALIDNPPRPELSEEFVNYLNFFEFIASLWQLGQLSLREIDMLFDYYLRLFQDPNLAFVRSYLVDNGFENLSKLIAYFPPRKVAGK